MNSAIKKYFLCWLFCLYAAVTVSARDVNWEYDPYSYQYDMTVYASLVTIDGVEVDDYSNLEIGAFVNEECRGKAEVRTHGEHRYLYLRVRSNRASGETIRFFVKNTQNGETYSVTETVAFGAQSVVGLPSSPFEMNAVDMSSIRKGDVNEDGEINILDVVATLSIMNREPKDYNLEAADANSDNVINIMDVLKILEIMKGE